MTCSCYHILNKKEAVCNRFVMNKNSRCEWPADSNALLSSRLMAYVPLPILRSSVIDENILTVGLSTTVQLENHVDKKI